MRTDKLLHLCPRLIWPGKVAEILYFEIQPLGLRLTGGLDLVTRRPFPNKHYKIACRKIGRNKGVNGILIEIPAQLDAFETVAQWKIEGKRTATHRVRYSLLDHDYDAATETMTLWEGSSMLGWPDRYPANMRNVAPVKAEPMMEVLGPVVDRFDTWDEIDETDGWIDHRYQRFSLPTLSRERLAKLYWSQVPMPPLADAFALNRKSLEQAPSHDATRIFTAKAVGSTSRGQ